MTSLNVVALISGGKDSFFSILHCQANGHNVVALANLHPPRQDGKDAVDDLESYMYQTVGHAVIPLYEQALGLPLYRQEITGSAVNHNKSYQAPQGIAEDETEALLPLLRKVMAAQPEVNAVSTGAILSDYQRTRVESVALRLGLVPLSYLWQWPLLPPNTPSSLLQDMAAVGQDSRIVKVASGGLDESFLWQNVSDPRTIHRLEMASQRFGTPGDGAVLGEGGEFETLAISGPTSLWKGSISILPEDVLTLPGEAGSASVRISNACVGPISGSKATSEVRKPLLLEHKFQAIHDTLIGDAMESADSSETPALPVEAESIPEHAICLRNMSGAGDTVADQTRSIMDNVMLTLLSRDQDPDHVAYTVIIMRRMEDFATVNAVYGSYFVNPNPPARATVACADVLNQDQLVIMDFTCTATPREGLHVQSRSYWAPANIGPYSQAVSFPAAAKSDAVDGAVYIAGQIPLVPASMNLPFAQASSDGGNFAMQTALALQHLYRIGRTMKVSQYLFGVALITDLRDASSPLQTRVNTVRRAWQAFNTPVSATHARSDEDEDDENFDIWHQKHGAGHKPWLAQDSEEVDDQDSVANLPPLVVILVDSLPRNAAVEWVCYGKSFASQRMAIPIHLQGLLHTFREKILSSDIIPKSQA